MTNEKQKAFNVYKRECVKAAKELGYPDSVRKAIDDSTNEGDLVRIMIKARREY